MRVAVCDDDKRLCHRMKAILEQYEETRGLYMEVELFYGGNELCESLSREGQYDLIFLDVLMAGINGIETGKYIRKVMEDQETKIIYISADERHIVELFQNQPTDFLKKPVKAVEIFRILDEIWKFGEKKRQYFLYRQGKLTHQVPFSEILYYQSTGRKVQIHTLSQIWEYNGKLSHLLREGLPSDFIYIHKSYIVNRNYISEKRYDKLYVAEEKVWLSISQAHRKEVRKRLEIPGFTTNYDRKVNEFCQKGRKSDKM